MYLRPHPVNAEFRMDSELDTNDIGFVEPQEIGITAGGVMVFIENAFVNVGKVRVVDRQNIAKIVEEYEFQQSDLTDESTAVEIGKQYYLNIKLISVETGEIIGSSIDKAEDATGFYEMCNQAVYQLL